MGLAHRLLYRGLGYVDYVSPRPWSSPDVPRIRGRKLQRLRQQLFDKHPLCQECERQGRVSIATIRDHIINLEEGGQDVESNTQALCQTCSDVKSQAEAKRGVARMSLKGQW